MHLYHGDVRGDGKEWGMRVNLGRAWFGGKAGLALGWRSVDEKVEVGRQRGYGEAAPVGARVHPVPPYA